MRKQETEQICNRDEKINRYASEQLEIKPNIQASYDISGKPGGPTAEAIYLKTELRLNIRSLKHNSPAAWSETEALCSF